ncbi:MAG: hypothetical protein JJU00_04905 [Opitutales bacterium]|nr:hypothetical protein [Opitutales bacterium]
MPKSVREDRGRDSRGREGAGHRDRRGARPPRSREGGGPRRDPRERGPRRQQGEAAPHAHHAPFDPIIEADFYPEDVPFKALAQAMRHSCRTYELFEIARVILEKPERFVCVAKHPDQKEGEPAILWASVPDGLPFLSEREASEHVLKHYLEQFFDVEEREVDPPAGTFQMVHRCGVTGELLGPPNYHRFQAICQEHHASKLPHMSFERFRERMETVREQEVIDAWLERMKKRMHYTLKDEFAGGEKREFDSLETARYYLLSHAKDKVVRPAYSARFSGKAIPLLPAQDPVRKSLETLHERQLRFPLDTANHLRGRLRRLNFAVYKKGSKGVSYVCAVKRRFRRPDEVMADNLADLISFIEAHPNLPEKELPRQYLGIEIPEKPEGGGIEELSETDKEKLLNLKRELKYLVSSGYVIEYSDGRLFVPAMRDEEGGGDAPEPIAKAAKKTKAKQKAPAVKAESGGEAKTAAAETAPGEAPEAPPPPAEESGEKPVDTPGAPESTAPETVESAPEPEPPSAESAPVSEPPPVESAPVPGPAAPPEPASEPETEADRKSQPAPTPEPPSASSGTMEGAGSESAEPAEEAEPEEAPKTKRDGGPD